MTEKKKKIALPAKAEDKPFDSEREAEFQKRADKFREPSQVQTPKPILEQGAIVEPERRLTQAERLEKIETQLEQAEKNFVSIAGYLDKMSPLLELAAQIQARQSQVQQNPEVPQQKGGFDMSNIFQMLGPLLSGGSQASSLDQEYINLAKESIKTDIDFTKSIKNALVSGIISRQTKVLSDSLP